MGTCIPQRQSIEYSVEKGEQQPGQTLEYRNPKHPNDFVLTLIPGLFTIHDCYEHAFNNFPNRPCLGSIINDSYQWLTYSQVKTKALHFGSGLLDLKLCPQVSSDDLDLKFLALYSKNCEAWSIADIACVYFNIVSVPLYDTLGASSTEHILKQTRVTTVVLSVDKIQQIIDLHKAGQSRKLRNLITISPCPEDLKEECAVIGLNVFSVDEIIKTGAKSQKKPESYKPSAVYTIIYTSGTTGNPKGVVITHENFLSTIGSAVEFFIVVPDDVHLSFLPLAHIFERAVWNIVFMLGGSIGYYSGDILKLKDDLERLKPTVLLCVPRLLSRFYDLIQLNLNAQTGLKASLISKALASKQELAKKAIYTHALYDRLVFSKIKNILGGRVRVIITGSAPIAASVLTFLKIAFCCPILEVYGQTETGPITSTQLSDPEAGQVGGPVGSIILKLVDVPEMNYFSTDKNEKLEPTPRGEICVKGPAITSGYFKSPKLTKELIDDQGWLHTGDIASISVEKSVTIIDRRKNIFKLSQGEYVAPEKVENVYIQSRFVTLAFLHGDSLMSYVVAVIVPERAALELQCKALGIEGTWEERCQDKAVIRVVFEDLEKLGKSAGLHSFEMAKKIYLHPELITPESGLLTPTFKLKRYEMRNFFKSAIDLLYSS